MKNKFGFVLLLIFDIIISCILFISIINNKHIMDTHKKVTATIVKAGNVNVRYSGTSGKKNHKKVAHYSQDVVYEYELNGETYTIESKSMSTTSQGYKIGSEISIYVDNNGNVAENISISGQIVILAFLNMIVIAYLICCLIRKVTNVRRLKL